MNSSDGPTLQPTTIRPAAPADLRDVLSICQARELADGAAVFLTAERLASEWEALGYQLAEQVCIAETADRKGL
jgi:hypothetical protein